MVGDKIAGSILLPVTAFLASRTHRPTWKWGVLSGIAAAGEYQLTAVLAYIVRFGGAAYLECHDFLGTMFWTFGLACVLGFLAVWRQYLHERHAV